MSEWNYDYLEAIGVPVWVPQQAEPAQTIESEGKGNQVVETTSFVSLLVGQNTAQVNLIVEQNSSADQAREITQKLNQAWKAWQGTAAPFAVWQKTDGTAQNQQNQQNQSEIQGACYQASEIPDWNIDSPQQRKDWWHFLQKLDEQNA